ncbi:MAG: ATP-binding protein [Solirubrobacterales bacterium]
MSISSLPVDQRVIDIDSRRFSSIEKALVELITNSDDSYSRLEAKGAATSNKILISYERHQNGAVLTVTDHAEGMSFKTILSVLSYGGAHSLMAKGEAGGRGYFGRGMKQAIYGLGHGWIESINEGIISRVDLFRGENGEYLFDDWNSGREVLEKDYNRLDIPKGCNGTRVTVIVENPLANIPYFSSLSKTITNNIYLRDILNRRQVELININQSSKIEASIILKFDEPESRILMGPDEVHTFNYNGRSYNFCITLKKALDRELVLRGNERTNGLLVISGTAVFDCQFFKYENQLGTEYLYGAVNCPGFVEMLAKGNPIISDEREGLNMKDPFVSAFSDAVSEVVSSFIKNEQLRLSHVDHATTSKRTQDMIENILKKMNQVASEDLGIILPPGPGTGTYGPFDTGRPAVLRFSTPFYYRKVNKKFNVTLIIDKSQLLSQDIISFNYNLGESMKAEPILSAILGSEIPEDGRMQFQITGSKIGEHGKIEAVSGPYAAACEIVIAENASGQGYGHPSGKPNRPWNMDNSTALFRGYELRNLSNDMDRAIYSPSERLILINTEAPTVRLYVNGQGHFKDGARLLLAELLLDVIAEELAKYYIDRTDQKGQSEAYRQAKQDIIRRYGVEVHSVLMGE